MICPVCNINPAFKHDLYGYLPCADCRVKQENKSRPNKQIEFTTDEIKEARKEYYHHIIPSHRKGQASKEYCEIYGRERMKAQGFTDKEIDKAKYVYYGDDTYYKEGN